MTRDDLKYGEPIDLRYGDDGTETRMTCDEAERVAKELLDDGAERVETVPVEGYEDVFKVVAFWPLPGPIALVMYSTEDAHRWMRSRR